MFIFAAMPFFCPNIRENNLHYGIDIYTTSYRKAKQTVKLMKVSLRKYSSKC